MRIFDREAQIEAGARLAAQLAEFGPRAVIYVREGGAAVGRAIAEQLSVPAYGIDIHYPWRRSVDRLPAALRAALWPLKELVYRALGPRPGRAGPGALPPVGRAVLVDDTASSGRTLRAALGALRARGFPREALRVAVIRCGPRARGQVDVFLTGERIRALR